MSQSSFSSTERNMVRKSRYPVYWHILQIMPASIYTASPTPRACWDCGNRTRCICCCRGNFSIEKVQATKTSFVVWRVDLSDTTDIQSKLITRIPEAELLDGMVCFSEDLLLGATKDVVWRLNIKTGEYFQAVFRTSMAPESGQPIPVGVNGIKTHDNHLYFSSTTQKILNQSVRQFI